MLMELRNIPSYKQFKSVRAHNVDELRRCETLEATEELLEAISPMSRFISVQRAIYEISGDAPEVFVSSAKSLAKLLMRVKSGEIPE